ncbi:hypothetical protein K432DRAFT_380535 [Lepidopterella palustris CBS 459.81]|uniref:Uncharacterized protein n=1 Tax=Lepidopterella palustris CBS 459.81 TaxID=1314670 RepID=A0A8E2EE18_9PEZI|nr:hypothetical protein K432DRAFT_380535 [Lepidopterella palustris CBS 459.81]
MKTSSVLAAVLTATITLVQGQITTNENGTITCAIPDGDYCAGKSLTTNIIVRCTNGIGQPGNCNDNLAGVPPVGVKTFAPCYQSSDVAGDAACSWDGIAYPNNGQPFPIPGGNGASSSSLTPTSSATSSSSVVVSTGTGYSTGSVSYSTPTGSLSLSYTPTAPTSTLPVFTGAAARVEAVKTAAGLLGLYGAVMINL